MTYLMSELHVQYGGIFCRNNIIAVVLTFLSQFFKNSLHFRDSRESKRSTLSTVQGFSYVCEGTEFTTFNALKQQKALLCKNVAVLAKLQSLYVKHLLLKIM